MSGQIDALPEADGATHFLLFLADGRAALIEASCARVQTHPSVDRMRRVPSIALEAAPAQARGSGR